MIGSRRPKIHPVIDGQKVISHRARQRVILHGRGEVVSAIAMGVAVTGACNDHSPRHRDPLAATSEITPLSPVPPPPTKANVYGNTTCARCVEKMWEMCVRVYNAFDPTSMWGSGAFFVHIVPTFCIAAIGRMRFHNDN